MILGEAHMQPALARYTLSHFTTARPHEGMFGTRAQDYRVVA